MSSLRQKIFSQAFCTEHKFSDRAFIRQRKLTFTRLVLFLLNQVKGAAQRELDDFFERTLGLELSQAPSTAALCKARTQLKPSAFLSLLRHVNELIADRLCRRLWNGHRVLAVDGSVITLPGQRHQARISTLYDCSSELFVDADWSPLTWGETVSLDGHLKWAPAGSIITLDRGYNDCYLIHQMIQSQQLFCLRARRGWIKPVSDFFDANCEQTWIEYLPKAGRNSVFREFNQPPEVLKLRLIRVPLPDGSVEVLITNLLDPQRYRSEQFGELYAWRWSTETGYRTAKSRLQIEQFSSYKTLHMQQDFFAKLVSHNLCRVVEYESEQHLEQPIEQEALCRQSPKLKKNEIEGELILSMCFTAVNSG